MSDYVHKKVIRYPLQGLMDRLNVKDSYDCEEELKEKLGILYNRDLGFEIEVTDKNFYLDFVYYYTYGDKSDSFGNVRLSTEEEINLIYPYLDKLFLEIDQTKIRTVEYCYYNCCECEDYYDLPENNDDTLVIKNVLDKLNMNNIGV